jgi:hypothetical protein
VCCESGIAYVPCNNHALASNALHDALHGTQFSRANALWLRSVREKMVLKGPAVRGIFAACYVKDLGAGAPVAFNFTDAWGLAFMLPFDRALVRKLYTKFKRRITRQGKDGAFLSSSPLSEKMEISDAPINTGFALIVAKGMGDGVLTSALEKYASSAFGAGWQGPRYLLQGAARTMHATALYALASAIEPGGGNFTRLFHDLPYAPARTQLYLQSASGSPGPIAISQAAYEDAARTLQVSLRQVGDPATLRDSPPLETRLTFANLTSRPRIEVNGTLLSDDFAPNPNGTLEITVQVAPLRVTTCSLRQ